MKKLRKSLFFLLIPLLSLFILSFNNVPQTFAKSSERKNENVNNNYKLTNQLKKQGYAYSLSYGNHDYILTNLSKKKYNKVIKNKIRFQVRSVKTYKNSINAKLVSKDGNYKVNADYSNDFYYTNSRNKELKPIVKLAKSIALNNDEHNKTNLYKLYRMIDKLKNKEDKSVAEMSFYQLKKYLKHESITNTPYLLLGNI